MGFLKKKKKQVVAQPAPAPQNLPQLPEFPRLADEEPGKISRLPNLPSSSLGKKFSQNTIKEAVTGEKEDMRLPEADDFDEDKMRMMQEPLKKPSTEKFGGSMLHPRIGRGAEPVFIRIDKFEEALKTFNATKRKISEIEDILGDIKRVKEREDKELQAWESEVKLMKTQIGKIDRDIFSKI